MNISGSSDVASLTEITDTKIPEFQADGNLPPGIYKVSWSDFEKKFGVNHGRKEKIQGLKKAMEEFRKAGGTKIYVDGSFVTTKKNPGDYDALYDLGEINVNQIDQILLKGTFEGRELQKRKYEGEFFPAFSPADILGTIYMKYFRRDKKTKVEKGIIQIELG